MNTSYAIINPAMLQIGDQFDRFQIQGLLAQGGMSEIYRAYDILNQKEVVLKIPDKTMIGDPAQFERFQREMEVVTTLKHPAILRGLDAGRYNRTPFLVTELVVGTSLRDLIASESPMPAEKAVPLIIKIAEGMAHCHENAVVHRDLKPENILVTAEDQPVIMDFGLALTKGSHRVTYSNLSTTMGTPDYMAPEQIDGQRGDARTDVYALGTILFEMLAGRLPFTGDNPMVVMAQHLNQIAPPLTKLVPGISPQLAAVVARSLQRNPEERYASMRAFVEALEHPETADLLILEKADSSASSAPWWKSLAFRSVAISVGILAAITLLAFLLQSFRP